MKFDLEQKYVWAGSHIAERRNALNIDLMPRVIEIVPTIGRDPQYLDRFLSEYENCTRFGPSASVSVPANADAEEWRILAEGGGPILCFDVLETEGDPEAFLRRILAPQLFGTKLYVSASREEYNPIGDREDLLWMRHFTADQFEGMFGRLGWNFFERAWQDDVSVVPASRIRFGAKERYMIGIAQAVC